MTKFEATAIRQYQLAGGNVTALELQQAISVLSRKPTPGRPYKFRLPQLAAPIREAANATLCFNLGLAIGRARPVAIIEGEKA